MNTADPGPMEQTALWASFQESGDADARSRLVEQNLPLVHHVARKLQRALPAEADFNDLVSAGTLGLISAVESFDPSRGLAFSTYAATRIHGAIIDDLRRWDHASRSVRRRQREIGRVEGDLSRALGRRPTDVEVAQGLSIDLDTLSRWKAASEDTRHVSLDEPMPSDGRETGRKIRDSVAGTLGGDIEDDLAATEEFNLLVQEIQSLKEQERVVLSLYFFKELKLHEIAQVLGVTESRISQIRTRAIKTLQSRMAYLRQEPA